MVDLIYYARPFTFEIEPLKKYKYEASILHELTMAFIVSTIPLSDYYHLTWSNVLEDKLFDLAEEMIKNCDLFVYKGESRGVLKELALAKKYGVPVIEYYYYLEELNED